jgi:hypothetical protein
MRIARALLQSVRSVPGLPAAAFLAGLLLIFQPAQVYEGNAAFFPQYNLWQMALVLVPGFLAAFVLLALFVSVGGPRLRRATAVIVSAVALAAWAGATFFTASKGLLDGSALLDLANQAQVRTNALWMAGFLVAGGSMAYFVPTLTRRFFAMLFLLLAAQAVWIAAADDKPWRRAADPARLVTVSKERNVLVILLDAFQSDFFTDMLEREPRLASRFPGFTHFPNAVGASPTTYFAMPVIHTGVRIKEGESLRRLYDQAVVKDSFLAKLAAAGYDAAFVNPVFGACPVRVHCDNSDQLVYGRVAVALDSSAFLLNLSLFRVLPHAWKPLVYRKGAWWLPWSIETQKVITSNRVLEMMSLDLKTGSAPRAVRFLHLFNTHAPITVDADCRRVHGRTWEREAAIGQDRCALSKVVDVLETLHRMELYDRTAIVILADHGSGMPREGFHGFRAGAQASPLLMVKPFGARAPLRANERVVGLGDVFATVCALTAACRAPTGSDIMADSDAAPSYPFVSYVWRNEFGVDSLPFDNRYEVRGPPTKIDSWWRVTNLPQAGPARLEFAKSDPQGAYGFGWGAFEVHQGRTLRWAVGSEADLYIDLDPSMDARLMLEISTHGGNAGQVMDVEVGGAKVGRVAVGFTPARHEVVVPARVLIDAAERIIFRFSKSNAPAPDPRKLAVLFDGLSVVQEKK